MLRWYKEARSMSKSIRYTSSPLLASKTPVWRSKFIVAGVALAFSALAVRAAYIQIFANEFFQHQGEVRFARTLELPANRGRILDRNGLILASSVPAPSIWAIPEDVEATKAQLAELAKLLEVPLADLNKKLGNEDKTFVRWLRRSMQWASRAFTSAKSTSADTPKGKLRPTLWASPMWKTADRTVWNWPLIKSSADILAHAG
jgi:cell division protein FtsI/penicillin-binding protein 2